MSSRDPSPHPKKRLAISLATGALLVPLSAVGASSLLIASTEEPTPSPEVSPVAAVGEVPSADLAVACGDEGMQLVAAEAGGSIGDVQQAALDALRDICAAAGLPLPAPAAPTPPSTSSPTVPASTVTTIHGDDDDHGRHGGDRDDDHDDDGADDDDREGDD